MKVKRWQVPTRPLGEGRGDRSRSTGLKTRQHLPERLQNTPKTPKSRRDSIPNTIAHISVADIAEIDKNKKLFTRGAVVNGRAGGGVPPWGRQSAARPGGAEQGVLDRQHFISLRAEVRLTHTLSPACVCVTTSHCICKLKKF